MKIVLVLAAATATLAFAASEADAQTRGKARARARVVAPAPAPLPPAAYRLIGPGSAEEAGQTSPAGTAPTGAAANGEDEAAAEAAPATPATGATPAAPAVRATPAAPAGGGAATPATRATPATPASAAKADDQEDATGSDAGPDTPERTRAQAALTRVIGELRTGNVDYARMSDAVATRVRTQQPALTPALTQYGAIASITPLGAPETDGSQRFRVTFAKGAATWMINTDAEGKVTNLGVE